MEFGRWELRDNSYTSYYFSKSAHIFPTSNSTDEGKLTTEENMRNIYRDLSTKNFVTKYNYFSLSINSTRTGLIVSPGECVIQGYHFFTNNSIEVKVPDNTIYDDNGVPINNSIVTQYTLGISLSYDAANHVTGDIVNKEAEVGESEVLSGVYLTWFDDCQLECYYDNILVLGRAYVQGGKIVLDNTNIGDLYIYHGFEQDPFKDHRYEAQYVEVEVHGHKTTKYDTLPDNMTQIHDVLYTYDSSHFPVELNRLERTKPPSHVTDIQDVFNHLPDWYTSKYGDYMTGALRFNNLSIDAIREYKNEGVIKDDIISKYADSVFISPRTYGDLTRTRSFSSVENGDFNYDVGGTLMSIVPTSYNITDDNSGYTGIHAALVSQKYGETGLRLHYGLGINEVSRHNTTRIVHYNENDNGQIDTELSNINNSSKFIIENIDNDGRTASINIKNGEIFIDSINSPSTSLYQDEEGIFNGHHRGSGIQFYVGGESTSQEKNIDFRIDETKVSIAKHNYINHRTAYRGTKQAGLKTDDLYFTLGIGIGYDENRSRILRPINGNTVDLLSYTVNTNANNNNPYMTLGNLRIRSNAFNDVDTKQTTIELLENKGLPFLRVRPRLYSEQYVAEELMQIGTSKCDDLYFNDAQDKTLGRIVMKKIGLIDLSNFGTASELTYFEQDYGVNVGDNDSIRKILNKFMPTINGNGIPNFDEVAGMYSTANIGCSSEELTPGTSNENRVGDISNNPYKDSAEWVRFTRFRYNLDKDSLNGGQNNVSSHDSSEGRKWGATYNLEFNTNIANERANQIIWRYKGSTGTQTDKLENTSPVVLSYIHDDSNSIKGTPTKYSDDNPAFEEWTDHNGNTHYNPTHKVRDFLMLENAGLSIHGDINNPSWCGDTLNINQHLGVTIVQGRVYNAIYNDFAETFEKDNKNDIAKSGDLIMLNPETGKYKICEGYENKLVVGIQSNSYAYLAGGNRIDGTQDLINLENEYFTVAVSGKVWVNVIKDSNIEPGDMLISSNEKGKATKSSKQVLGTIIGKALTEPKYFEEQDEYKVLVLVMTA